MNMRRLLPLAAELSEVPARWNLSLDKPGAPNEFDRALANRVRARVAATRGGIPAERVASEQRKARLQGEAIAAGAARVENRLRMEPREAAGTSVPDAARREGLPPGESMTERRYPIGPESARVSPYAPSRAAGSDDSDD